MSIVCIICRNPPNISNPLTKEHIVPESIGGSLTIDRVCKNCNSTMGSDFEGEVVNYFFFKAIRHTNQIPAKRGRSVAHPLKGIYASSNGSKIEVDGNLKQRLISNYEVTSINKASGKLSMNIALDPNNLNNLESELSKKLARLEKEHNIIFHENSLKNAIKEISNTPSKPLGSITAQLKFQIDLGKLELFYLKIAYELSYYNYGDSYLKDSTGKNIANILKNKAAKDTDCFIEPLVNDSFIEQTFSVDFHWVIFKGHSKFCLVGLKGIWYKIKTSSNINYPVKHQIYRFCYKTQTWTGMSITNFALNSINQA